MKVSVCIVTYNHESYIRETLDSVLMQDFDHPYEIVVGDDASIDRTPEILQEYADRYPDRFKLILHEKNLGPRGNVQSVRKQLTGEYIAVLDGDDFWTNAQKLQKQISFLDENPSFSASAGLYRSVVEKKEHLHGPPVSPDQPEVIDMERFLDGVWIGASSFVYRFSMVPEIPNWIWKLKCGDKGLQFLCVEQGPIRFFNEEFQAYRIHGGGMYSGIQAQKRLGWMIEYLKAFDQHLDGAYSDILHPRIAGKYYLAAYMSDQDGDWAASREALRHARAYSSSVRRVVTEEARHLVRRIPPLHRSLRKLKTRLRGHAASSQTPSKPQPVSG
jgi:glycosyltransferase involved in cell wall biosynthesis